MKLFGDVSDYILGKVMDHPGRASFFVTDHYLDDSIKSLERRKRADLTGILMQDFLCSFFDNLDVFVDFPWKGHTVDHTLKM